MKTFFLLAALAAIPWMSHGAEDVGELFFTNLASAPFPHPQRADGHRYGGQHYPAEKHYRDNRVAIFVPKNFRAGTNVDFVVHFHGWRARLDRVLEKFELVGQFAASGRNAILVVPQGPLDAPDSFGGKLEDAGGFQRFMDEVLGVLRERGTIKSARLGRVILSGHSGGYRVISSILDTGGLTPHIAEVWLFDALYGRSEKFRAWIERGNGRLINIYTAGGGTKAETEKFIAVLKAKQWPVLARGDAGVTVEELRKHRLIFLFTALDHNGVLHRNGNFRDYLMASGLAER